MFSGVFFLFISHSTETETADKDLETRGGSAVKFEEGMGTTEGDPAAPVETGDEPDGL